MLLGLAIAGYCGVILYFSPLLLQDYPNHLARAVVMADLLFDHGRQFGQTYVYHFLFAPYVFADWVLAGVVRILGVSWAMRLWPVVIFLSLPAALYAYLRATQASMTTTITVLLIGLYLSTDTFFVLGFLSFRLAIALVLLALALAELLGRRWSGPRYVALVAIVVVGYLTHLAALGFMAIALGTRSLVRLIRRTSTLRHEFLLLLPVGATLVWHFAVATGYRLPSDQVIEADIWGTPLTKAAGFVWELLGFRSYWQMLVLATFFLCLLVLGMGPLRSWMSRRGREPLMLPDAVLEPWGMALSFLGAYVVLPSSYSEASFVDVRALALFWLFFLIGLARLCEALLPTASRGLPAFVPALVLVTLNLTYLAKQFWDDRLWLIQYRSVVARVPGGSDVLPVYTGVKTGVVRSRLHADSFVVIDRAAMIPYLFSGDRGDPMKYFRYVNRPYTPDEAWYGSRQRRPLNWADVKACYSFLLVMKPFEPDRIALHGPIVAENQTAVLMAIR